MDDPIDSAQHHAVIEALYRQHYDAMLRLAIGITGDRACAEDACQNVFQKLIARKDPPAVITLNYLLTATRHACLDDLRKSRRLAVLEDTHPAPPPPDPDEAQWVAALMAEWHASLTDHQKEAIAGRQDGASRAEIAALMGCDVDTVRTHLCRARRKLRVLAARERERERERKKERKRDDVRTHARDSEFLHIFVVVLPENRVPSHLRGSSSREPRCFAPPRLRVSALRQFFAFFTSSRESPPPQPMDPGVRRGDAPRNARGPDLLRAFVFFV